MVTRRDFIRKTAVTVSALAVPCLATFGRVRERPNVVLFISDDHGYADSGAYGDTYIKTPNIDRLAAQSMRFTHAFAASPLCSPSRCVIETGLMPFRNGGHKFGTPINSGIRTMPEYFKEMGYYTAHIGKFHHSPRKQFPYDFVTGDENKTPEFLSNYRENKPLLLIVCSHPPHTPWIKNFDYDPLKIKLPPNFIDTRQTRLDRANYYSDVTLMDSILGRVLEAVSNHLDSKNTLFAYTSDQGSNWPFAKWCLYDAGLRAPLLVRWPGRIAPGAITDAMVDLSDLLPTFIELAGGRPPQDIDGRSFLGVLTGEAKGHRKAVFGTHTGNDNGGPGIANHCPARTIRTATHRYILNLDTNHTFDTHITGCQPPNPHHLPFWESWVQKAKTDTRARALVDAYQHRPLEELYDLTRDPWETNNIAGDPQNRHLLDHMRKQLAEWRKEQGDTVAADAATTEN